MMNVKLRLFCRSLLLGSSIKLFDQFHSGLTLPHNDKNWIITLSVLRGWGILCKSIFSPLVSFSTLPFLVLSSLIVLYLDFIGPAH